MAKPKGTTYSIYLTDDYAPHVKAAKAEHGGIFSKAVAAMLEKQYGLHAKTMCVVIRFNYSDSWRKAQVLAGLHAPERGEVRVFGAVPECLMQYASVSERVTTVSLFHTFDQTPTMDEILAAVEARQ